MQPAVHTRCSAKPASLGFTLVELLAVIVIIAILAALTLAGLTKMRESGQAAACLSNLRQISAACQLYSGDNQGLLIPIARGTSAADAQTWRALLIPYLGTLTEAIHCPSDPGQTLIDANNQGVFPSSYGLNKTINVHEYLASPAASQRLVNILKPSATILASDIAKVQNPASSAANWITSADAKSVANYGYGHFPTTTAAAGEPWYLVPRHKRRANVAFYDGHVASIDVDREIIPYSTGQPRCLYDNN